MTEKKQKNVGLIMVSFSNTERDLRHGCFIINRSRVSREIRKAYLGWAQEPVREKTEKLLDRLMEAEPPEFLADASNSVPGEFRNSYYSRNSIESFNSLLKRQTRKRILMNSEGNALITVASVCSSYNSRAHRVKIRAMSGMDEEERASLFIEG